MKHPFSLPQEIAQEPIQTIFSRKKAKKWCYDKTQVNVLPFDQDGNITLEELFKVLPIRVFCLRFAYNTLTEKQAQWFAFDCAKFVLPYFENVYPNIHSVRKCIEVNEQYLLGNVDIKVLISAINTVNDTADTVVDTVVDTAAYTAADAADAVYYAASAAYDAADAYIDGAAADAVNTVIAAHNATDDFKPFVENWLKNLLKHQNN
jgi:hypothetical protein